MVLVIIIKTQPRKKIPGDNMNSILYILGIRASDVRFRNGDFTCFESYPEIYEKFPSFVK